MGLYLCVFDGDDEIEGVEIGSYADFDALRGTVRTELERGSAGSVYPVFGLHSDCDGEWSVEECEALRDELDSIVDALKQRPSVPFHSEWQRNVAKSIGLVPNNAYESFIDVDGELLLERLRGLVSTALKRRLPILFQ
jgi:hypothetical protein